MKNLMIIELGTNDNHATKKRIIFRRFWVKEALHPENIFDEFFFASIVACVLKTDSSNNTK